MADYIDREKLIRDLIDKGFYPAIVKRAIENAPAVSIVPRSEYDAKAKQEVAKQIFEEFEYLIWQFDTRPASDLKTEIAELKKKYIGKDTDVPISE